MCEAIFSVPVSVLQFFLHLGPALFPWGWISLLKLIVAQLVREFPPFMVTEGSLRANVFNLELDEPSFFKTDF
jgi:hypothetical protein